MTWQAERERGVDYLAPVAARLKPGLAEPAATELVAHYMAAVYLQSMWLTRLGHYQAPVVDLPDYYSFEKNFRALASQWRAAGGHP